VDVKENTFLKEATSEEEQEEAINEENREEHFNRRKIIDIKEMIKTIKVKKS
jgi:hypothetical protein